MVFFSSRISPRASTVIFWDRSPRATAVVTWAMLRTWVVRLPAMKLTESVRSFQVPRDAGHLGLAAEAALGAHLAGHPGDLGRRTSDSWSTIVLTVFFSSSISPATSTVIFWDRSPLATAVVTCAMSRTWPVRLPAMQVHRVGEVLPGAGHARHLRPGRPGCPRCRPRGPPG